MYEKLTNIDYFNRDYYLHLEQTAKSEVLYILYVCTLYSMAFMIESTSLLSSWHHGYPPRRKQALFETTKRLLSQIVNEGLASVTVEILESTRQQQLCLHDNETPTTNSQPARWVKVNLRPGTRLEVQSGRVISLVRPVSIEAPVILGDALFEREEWDPETVFLFMCPWFVHVAGETMLEQIACELRNTADNQGQFLEKLPSIEIIAESWET